MLGEDEWRMMDEHSEEQAKWLDEEFDRVLRSNTFLLPVEGIKPAPSLFDSSLHQVNRHKKPPAEE